MSWIVITSVILIATFACAYGLCEWIARRRPRGDDASMG